ncbi:MAG: glycosyltransferase family 39 protein [Acidobacteriota bacterium]
MMQSWLDALRFAAAALPFVAVVGGVAGGFLAVCHGLGRILVRGDDVSLEERLLLSAPFGMLVLSLACFLLAALGQLKLAVLGVLCAALLVVAHRAIRQDAVDLAGALRPALRRDAWREHALPMLGGVAFLAASAGLLLQALYPRLDFDESLYHLPFTRALLETGSLPDLPHLRYPYFPIAQEALWTPIQAALGQCGPSVLSAAQTAWVALLLVLWVGRGAGLGTGAFAACLWLGCPIAWWTGTQAQVDAGLALCFVVAAYCIDRWEATEETRWVMLSGFALGGAAASKYHGLLLLVLMTLVVVIGRDLRRRVPAAALLLAGTLPMALPMYGWITASTSNPVFPFAAHTFGASEWSQFTRTTGGPEAVRSSDVSTVFAVRARAALEKLDQLPETLVELLVPNGGAPEPLSLFLLLLLPFCLVALLRPGAARAGRWALVCLAFFAIWFATAREPRYLFSIAPLALPLYALGLSAAGERLPKRFSHVLGITLCAALLFPGANYAAGEVARLGALPTSGLEREQFLRKRRPGYNALRNAEAHWANVTSGEVPPKIFTLFGADLQYFAIAPLYGDWYGPYRFSQYGDFRFPAVVETLRAQGFDYILEVHRRTPPTIGYYPGLYQVYGDKRSKLWQILEEGESPETQDSDSS